MPADVPPSPDTEVAIGHVHLKVSDLERAIAFYRDTLGFEVTGRFADQAALLTAGSYHHHIGLNTFESQGGAPPQPGTTGLHHAAIRYPTRCSLVDALRRLRAQGVLLTGASDHGITESLYLTDPDGNGIELYWDRPRDHWPRTSDGMLALISLPLDVESFLASEPAPSI